jgi:hypothetical protein
LSGESVSDSGQDRELGVAILVVGFIACILFLLMSLGVTTVASLMVMVSLFIWYVVFVATMAVLTYFVLVGTPSWRAMKQRWRWLHQFHYRY